MKNFQELLVECWYDKVDLESIHQWAYEFVENNDDIPEEVFELLDADKYQFEAILLKLSQVIDSDFSPQSLNAEILAAKHLISLAAKYLIDGVTPMDVCRVVNKIDSGFLDAPRGLPDNIAYYPDWLGNLYNSCDWCDDTWTCDSAPHLKQDLEAHVIQISAWVESHNKSLKSDTKIRAL